MMRSISRNNYFWAGLTALSIASIIFTVNYFSTTHNMVNIDLQMSRDQALKKTEALAKQHQWKPTCFRSAANFENDHLVQFYAELECGGNETFKKIITEKWYSPYTWKVRHFQEHVTHETEVTYTPEGDPYGFKITLPETETNNNISSSDAREKIEQIAQEWNINLSQYERFETSQEEHPSGRIDHTFVYQHKERQLGDEGKYRIQFVVSGNKVSELKQFVHVPESFQRRYQELRASNNGIASATHMISMLLFFLFGCFFGGFWLFKQNKLLFKQASLWGFIISGLYLLSEINEIPLLWMQYNTALPASSFLIQIIMQKFLLFFQLLFISVITFAVGESLTRTAFGNQIQLWKSWNKETGSSITILGHTVSSYLLTGILLGISTATYLFLMKVCGWWSPGSSSVSPNIIATYQPWISSIGHSLFAGFREECLFRAVPLAGAALLGRYFKKERAFLVGAFIFQAIIFAAVHANYTTMPSYFRVVEITPIGLFFGAIYLLYGLLPAILIHWLFDYILMSMPVFISHAPGMWIHQLIILLIGALPLCIIAYRRYQNAQWNEVPSSDLNSGWIAPDRKLITENTPTSTINLSPHIINSIIIASLVSLSGWIITGKFKSSDPTITLSKQEAINATKRYIQEKNQSFSNGATYLTSLRRSEPAQEHFAWEQLGPNTYKKLYGSYLMTPSWTVRVVNYTKPIVERAEEYIVFINKDSSISKVTHTLPELTKKESLSRSQTESKAYSIIKDKFNLDKSQIKLLSAEDSQKPHRKDWKLTFEDTTVPLKEGAAHIIVTFTGDILSDVSRKLHIPETFTRDSQKRNSQKQVINYFVLIFLLILSGFGFSRMLSHLLNGYLTDKKYCSLLTVGIVTGTLFFASLLSLYNQMPLFSFMFDTAQPYYLQLTSLFTGSVSFILLQSLFIALIIVGSVVVPAPSLFSNNLKAALNGVTSGTIIYTLYRIGISLSPSMMPLQAPYSSLINHSTFLSDFIPVIFFVRYTGILFVFFWAMQSFVSYFRERNFISYLATSLLGAGLVFFLGEGLIPQLLLPGLIMAITLPILYHFIFKRDCSVIPVSLGTFYALSSLKQGILLPYPSALMHSIIQIVLLMTLAYYWHKTIRTSCTN